MKESVMKVEMVDIGKVKPYEKNPRKIPPEAVERIAASIKEFGFRQPIVVDKDFIVIVGHARLMAAKKLGMTEVPVHVAENLTKEQVRAYRLADNKTNESSLWNERLLNEELKGLGDFEFDMSLFGFEEKSKEDDSPQVDFGEVVMENHNYILLVFDNELDWLAAQTHFGLKTVASRRTNNKPGSWGIGRVVNGGKYLNEIKGMPKHGF